MDSTVVEEIANQLGMAVDQAGQFIAEQLPAFAALKTIQASVPLIVCGSLFVISLIILIASILSTVKSVKKEKERFYADRAALDECERYKINRHCYDLALNDYDSYSVVLCSLAATLFLLVVFILAIVITVPEIIGWCNYPEAMLIDTVLHRM